MEFHCLSFPKIHSHYFQTPALVISYLYPGTDSHTGTTLAFLALALVFSRLRKISNALLLLTRYFATHNPGFADIQGLQGVSRELLQKKST